MSEKTFSSKVEQKSGGMAEAPPELTVEQKLDIALSHLQAHATALNAISFWIVHTDKKVAKAGTVIDWAIKEQQRLNHIAAQKEKRNGQTKK